MLPDLTGVSINVGLYDNLPREVQTKVIQRAADIDLPDMTMTLNLSSDTPQNVKFGGDMPRHNVVASIGFRLPEDLKGGIAIPRSAENHNESIEHIRIKITRHLSTKMKTFASKPNTHTVEINAYPDFYDASSGGWKGVTIGVKIRTSGMPIKRDLFYNDIDKIKKEEIEIARVAMLYLWSPYITQLIFSTLTGFRVPIKDVLMFDAKLTSASLNIFTANALLRDESPSTGFSKARLQTFKIAFTKDGKRLFMSLLHGQMLK